MDKPISIFDIEKLVATRPSYDLSEDCPFTEEIALAAAAGTPIREIAEKFPHLNECALCRESIQLFEEIEDSVDDSVNSKQTHPHTMYTVPLPPPASRFARVSLAVAAVLLIGVAGSIAMHLWHTRQRQTAETTLTPKGAVFDMEIAVNRNGAGFPLEQGDMVETGDNLGFFYSATQNAYLALFHVNEQRELSTLFPANKNSNALVETGTRLPIKDGALVTPASSCEWIVAVFSEKSMSINQLKGYLKNGINISKRSGTCDIQIEELKEVTIKVQQIRK